MTETNFMLITEFIELNALLKVLSLASSGGAAKMMIGDGLVEVDGVIETRIRRKLRGGELIKLGDECVRITRGGAA
jgi:ribosome-associated protein